jgi:WD40 repeat protein
MPRPILIGLIACCLILAACAPATPIPDASLATPTLEPTASRTNPASTRTPTSTFTPTPTVTTTRAPITLGNADSLDYAATLLPDFDYFGASDFVWYFDSQRIFTDERLETFFIAWGSKELGVGDCNDMELAANGVLIANCDNQIVRLNFAAMQQGDHDFGLVYEGQPFTDIAVSPDGGSVAAAHDTEITLIDVATREVIGRMQVGSPIRSIAFSPDGAMLASVNNAGSVWLWGVADQRSLNTFRGGGSVSLVVFSPDTTLLAGASESSIHLWFVQSAGILASFSTHPEPITAMTFHTSGKLLATGGQNGALIIWDAVTGLPLMSANLASEVLRIAWSPDSTRLAALTADGTIHIWQSP